MNRAYRIAVLSLTTSLATFAAAPSSHAALVLSNSNVNQAFLASETTTPANPNGPFQYGYSLTPGGNSDDFRAYTSAQHTNAFVAPENAGVTGYYIPTDQFVPAVVINTTGAPFKLSYGPTLEDGQILLHPGGIAGSNAYDAPIYYADLRYIAPVAGKYSLSGVFSKLDDGQTEALVLLNGVNQFDAFLDSRSPTASFNFSVNLEAGDKIDFLVGQGRDNSIGSDSTGLFANVAIVTPEPSTFVHAFMGGAALLGFARYRTRAARRQGS